VRFIAHADDGTAIDFECADTLESRWTCGSILEGRTYPFLPFVEDVRVVFDVGANCGATSVHLARHYPDAEVHAFEPASEPRALLERNAADWSNVSVHPFGLGSEDAILPLYKGEGDSGLASLIRRSVNLDESELVQLHAGDRWAAAQGIDRIDVLKVDVEGSEVAVLQGLAGRLPTVKLLYLEYDSRQARRTLDRLLEPTHVLYSGVMFMDQGEIIYLRNDIADLAAATDHLRAMLRAQMGDNGS
jgi:FkbM family methyltransferase